jgi:prepilin-type N-terminal cleavage/methylation domain-containing protein
MKSRWNKRLLAQQGMTLIEISITLLIIATALGLATVTLTNITHARLKSSASKLAGAIRYTYELAGRKNAPFRLALDLDQRAYWVESSSSQFLLVRDKEEVHQGMIRPEDQQKEHSRRFVTRSMFDSVDIWKPKAPPVFAAFAGPLTKKQSLPDEISFKGVWVAHQRERVTAGMAYLYCFQTGMTERAAIYLTDASNNVFTLIVEPLTGRVNVASEYLPEE